MLLIREMGANCGATIIIFLYKTLID